MSPKRTMHMPKHGDDIFYAMCGRALTPLNSTSKVDEVSCTSCIAAMIRRGIPKGAKS